MLKMIKEICGFFQRCLKDLLKNYIFHLISNILLSILLGYTLVERKNTFYEDLVTIYNTIMQWQLQPEVIILIKKWGFRAFLIFLVLSVISISLQKYFKRRYEYINHGGFKWKVNRHTGDSDLVPYCRWCRLKLHKSYDSYLGYKFYCQKKPHPSIIIADYKYKKLVKEVINLIDRKYDK